MILIVGLLVSLIIFVAPPGSVSAAAGDLDFSFGNGGKLLLDFGLGSSNDTYGSGVALQPDGKIIVSGQFFFPGGSALARLNPDGSPDQSFGSGGVVRPALDDGHLALQADGKIVVQGFTGVSRYNPGGTVDTSFGSGGRVTTGFFNYDLIIQPDQKIVVVGQSGTFTGVVGGGFAVARYKANGTLDLSFGTSGKVETLFTSFGDAARAVALQSDGKIVVAGDTPAEFAVARYSPDGSLDANFGSGGKVTRSIAARNQAASIEIGNEAKIVIGGSAGSTFSTTDFVLLRYNSDGTPDSSFGTTGYVTTDFGQNRRDKLAKVMLQKDGKIVAAGGADRVADTATGPASWLLTRYNTDGSLDQSFGSGGAVETVTTAFGAIPAAAAMQWDGRIVVTGMMPSGGSFRAGVARYLNDGSGLGPTLLTEDGSDSALAFDSVTRTRDPFSVSSVDNFSPDHRTRIMLFAVDLNLQPTEDAGAVTALAEDSQLNTYPLEVEYVGQVPGFAWLRQVNVKLDAQLANAGEVLVSISVHGADSNKVRIRIAP